jgi:hypothetical protein
VPTKNVREIKLNYVTTKSPNAQRERIIRWDDALALTEAGRTMSGREFPDAMLRGERPLPPILQPESSAFDAAIRERNQ